MKRERMSKGKREGGGYNVYPLDKVLQQCMANCNLKTPPPSFS